MTPRSCGWFLEPGIKNGKALIVLALKPQRARQQRGGLGIGALLQRGSKALFGDRRVSAAERERAFNTLHFCAFAEVRAQAAQCLLRLRQLVCLHQRLDLTDAGRQVLGVDLQCALHLLACALNIAAACQRIAKQEGSQR